MHWFPIGILMLLVFSYILAIYINVGVGVVYFLAWLLILCVAKIDEKRGK